ncbi:MAG: hypothetical protein ACI88A_004568 [Paraglaciecola sp.]|jgi:hypothetical protein
MIRILVAIFLAIFIISCSSPGGFAKSSNPEDKFIDITGHIDINLTYKIKVEYRTTANLSQCTNYHISLGRDVAQQYEANYYPKINGNSHAIKLPLAELEPNTKCKWQPVMAFVCVGAPNEEPTTCSSVFSFRGEQDIDLVTTIECEKSNFCLSSKNNLRGGAINEFNRSYQLNIVAK